MSNAAMNTDPPDVRCKMCGGRCRWDGPRWIKCPHCPWSSHDPRRVGWRWRLSVFLGRRITGSSVSWLKLALAGLLIPLPVAFALGWGVSANGVYLRDDQVMLIGEPGFWWGFRLAYLVVWGFAVGAVFIGVVIRFLFRKH